MVYDRYYNYMYIDKNNSLVAYNRNILNPAEIKVETVGRIMDK